MDVSRRSLFGVLCLSCAVLMDEVMLTRIFSVMAAHHFAFMVVSIAMFATGLASMRLYLTRQDYPPEGIGHQLNSYSLAFALSVLATSALILHIPFKLDISVGSFVAMSLLYVVAGIPLYLGGFALSLALYRWSAQLGRVYAFDLVGAALGCALTVLCLDSLSAGGTLLMVALLAVGSASLFMDHTVGAARKGQTAAVAVAVLALFAAEPAMRFFEVRYVLGVDPGRPLYVKWNTFSRIAVYPRQDGSRGIAIDAGAATDVMDFHDHKLNLAIQNFQARASSLPFRLRPFQHVLVIGAGGGEDVLVAFLAGAKRVTGVEINPATVHYVRDLAREFTGNLYGLPGLELVNDDARSYVQRSSERFDLIQMSLIDTFAATGAGAFTLTENNLYTQEAFDQYVGHLTEDGILNISRWNNEVFRVLTLGCTSLRKLGVQDLRQHVLVLSGGGLTDYNPRLTTILFKRSPFTEEEARRLEDLTHGMNSTVLYSFLGPRQPQLASIIECPNLEALYSLLPMDISPPTDDRPFFFYTLKLSRLWPPNPAVLRDTLSPSNTGLYLLLCVMVIASVLVLALIVWPMRSLRRELGDHPQGMRLGPYFASCGLGFMLLEVGLLQKFSLFLGSPALSLSVVLATLLLASGLGSYTTLRVPPDQARRAIRFTVLALTILLAAFILLGPALLQAALPLTRSERVLVCMGILAPIGVLLGRCLPLGVRAFEPLSGPLMPWLWGINTIFSVAASILAVFISMNWGFTTTECIAALLYLGLLVA